MVTIRDISKKTGYSTTTVSKSLNDYKEIPQKTKDKIKKTAAEMGYVPNYSAKSLKTRKSWTIGVIYNGVADVGLQHPFFSKILDSFRREVEAKGYDIMFIAKSFGGRKASYYEHAMMKGVEGIFTLCADFNADDIVEVFASSIPNVVIDFISSKSTTITSSTKNSIHEAISDLKNLGHVKIAHIHGSENTFTGNERKKYFTSSMTELGLDIVPEYLISGEYFTKGEGYYAMNQLLKLNKIPTAVFCASDMLAIGALEAIQEHGLTVPNDISLIGFDGIDMCQMFSPKLSTILQDTKEMGIKAANMIFKMIDSKTIINRPSVHTIDSIYLKKDSTKSI